MAAIGGGSVRLRTPAWGRWACAGLLLGAALAAPAPAQAQAQTGYQIRAAGCAAPAVVSTTELFVSHTGFSVGANGGSIACASNIGADTGIMSASATIDWSSGSVGLLEFESAASISERIWIDGLKTGETAWIDARLALTAAATVAGAPGSARGYGVLNVAGCRITRTVYSNGTVSDNPNCTWGVAGGDPAGIFVSVPITSDRIGPSPLGNYVTMSAAVGGLVTSLSVGGIALAESAGQLAVSTSTDGGASFRFANPATLTAVPEPGATALGLGALGALAACRRATHLTPPSRARGRSRGGAGGASASGRGARNATLPSRYAAGGGRPARRSASRAAISRCRAREIG
jgi:hypothetical protein